MPSCSVVLLREGAESSERKEKKRGSSSDSAIWRARDAEDLETREVEAALSFRLLSLWLQFFVD